MAAAKKATQGERINALEEGMAATLAAVQGLTTMLSTDDSESKPAAKGKAKKAKPAAKTVKLKPLDGFVPVKGENDRIVCWVGIDPRSKVAICAKNSVTDGNASPRRTTDSFTTKSGDERKPRHAYSGLTYVPNEARETLAELLVSAD